MALLVATAFTACFVLAVYGFRWSREPGVETSGLAMYVVAPEEKRRAGLVGRLLAVLDRSVGGWVLGRLSPDMRRRVRASIIRAGSPDGLTVESYVQRQATWAFLGLVLAVLMILADGFYLGLCLPLLGWFLPWLRLRGTADRRNHVIERELPDFLDVLAVTISAGLSFRSSLRRVASMVGGPVGDEMLTALRQIDLGMSRRHAFEEMRERTDAPSLHNFITSFLQAEELGTPVTGFLEDYAKELRRTAGQRARTAAARANPKISLVLTLVIMPALTIFLIGSILLMAVFES